VLVKGEAAQVLNIRRFDTPTEDVIEHLQLEPGTPVVYIKRLFLFDDKPKRRMFSTCDVTCLPSCPSWVETIE